MSANSTDTKSSERKNTKNLWNIARKKPPVYFNIVVPGVGLEPTKACARGS